MIVRAVLLLWCCAASGAQERAFVEAAASVAEVFVGQPIRVTLRFALERELRAERLVPLFRQRLDLPVQLDSPWKGGVEGVEAFAPADEGGDVTVAVDGEVVLARRIGERTVDGRVYEVFEIERGFTPTAPGEVTFAAPSMRFAFATRFEEDLVRGRVPADRQESIVAGEPVGVRVLPLPSAGRPADHSGAIGALEARVEATPRDVEVGATVRVVLTIEGDGDLRRIEPPRLDGLPGFHLLGRVEEPNPSGRTFAYDLTPLEAGAVEVPPIALSYFDPATRTYGVARTEPIRLRVSGEDAPVVAEVEPEPAERDEIFAAGEGSAGLFAGRPPLWLAFALAIGPWLVCLLALLWRPGRVRDDRGARVRRRRALQRFDADVREDRPMVDAFARFVATHLGTNASAIVAPDLELRLVRAGVEVDLARRAADALRASMAARYGGAPPPDRGEVRDVVEELHAAFEVRR